MQSYEKMIEYSGNTLSFVDQNNSVMMYQISRMQARIPMMLLMRQPHPPWPPVSSRNNSEKDMPIILPSKYSTRTIAPSMMNHAGVSI